MRFLGFMKYFLIAIDGNCGSGKSTLSEIIKENFDCNIFHMDDYYLPFSKRGENWEMLPAGNMDIKRFLEQVVLPAKRGEEVLYQPYYCREDRLREVIIAKPKPLTVIEGSYSHHPVLAKYYDWKLFLTCSRETQMQRLARREGERVVFYEQRWIPMEERYYQAYAIKEHADKVFDTQAYEVYGEIIDSITGVLQQENKYDKI